MDVKLTLRFLVQSKEMKKKEVQGYICSDITPEVINFVILYEIGIPCLILRPLY